MTIRNAALLRALSLLLAALFLPLSLLTGGLDAAASGQPPQEKTNLAGPAAFFRSQGVTTDGAHLWFSAKTTLLRTALDGKTPETLNLSAIPAQLKEDAGIAHIGGISWYDGRIYAGMEDSKVWQHPTVGVFDAETLEFQTAYALDPALVTRGVPWVAVERETGLLYCADHSKTPTCLCIYALADGCRLTGTLPLQGALPAVQGAEIRGGVLYAASNDETAAIYTVNLTDGRVDKLLDRNLLGGEGEGLTILETADGPVLLAIDLGTLFVNAFVRRYPLAGTD
ncbi:MAG: hypothetical protein IK080_08020 [Clostridia bacterium]|nr:hypothetical protein [Clostridia bacterium]